MNQMNPFSQPQGIKAVAANALKTASAIKDVAMSKTQQLKDTISRKTESIQLPPVIQETANKLVNSKVAQQVMAQCETASEEVIAYTQKKPKQALLIALGVGVALGWLLRGSDKDED
jgi:ElaB/YqjD/DUF883 family membrane-anchored ribosome-binding protein